MSITFKLLRLTCEQESTLLRWKMTIFDSLKGELKLVLFMINNQFFPFEQLFDFDSGKEVRV